MNYGLLSAFVAEVVLISYRSVKRGLGTDMAPIGIPLPSDYLAAIIAFGALGLTPPSVGKIPTAIGWGLVLATALNMWDPANPWNVSQPGTTGTTLSHLGATPAAQATGTKPTKG